MASFTERLGLHLDLNPRLLFQFEALCDFRLVIFHEAAKSNFWLSFLVKLRSSIYMTIINYSLHQN